MSRAVIQGYNLLCLLELNRIEGSSMLKVNFPAVSKIYLQSVNSRLIGVQRFIKEQVKHRDTIILLDSVFLISRIIMFYYTSNKVTTVMFLLLHNGKQQKGTNLT